MKKVMLLMLVMVMLGGSASALMWEEDMSVDPIPGPWNLRAGGYTMGGGVMSIAQGTSWTCVIDQVPDDPFVGTTTVRMVWRATSGVSNATQGGVGLWCNVGCFQNDPDKPEQVDEDGMYSYIRFFSGMNAATSPTGQIFGISGTGVTVSHNFGLGMLTLDAVINYDLSDETEPIRELTYTVTDGTITESDTITFGEQGLGGATRGWFTMYSRTPAGEIDYIKIDNRVEGAESRGAAHTPDPDGTTEVDSTVVSSVNWKNWEQEPNGVFLDDPNIVSIDGYDVWWSVGVEPNYVTDTPAYQGAPDQDYTPGGGINYNTTYYWRVDSYVTWDSNEITGNFTDVIESSQWQFTTLPEYTEPVLTNYDNVITAVVLTTDPLFATLSATITGNSNAMNAPVFTLLDDDIDFPAGSDAVLTDTTGDNQNPTAELSTSMAGLYKVRLEIDDGTTSLEGLAEVNVYADACEAQKAAPSGWTANYYDQDEDCDVDVNDLRAYAINWLDDTSMAVQETTDVLAGYTPADVFAARIETEWAALGPIAGAAGFPGSTGNDMGWVTGDDPNMYGDDPNSCSDHPMWDGTGAPQLRDPAADGAAYGDDVSGARFSNSRSGGFFADYKIDVPVAAVGIPVDVYCNYAVNADRVVRFSSAVLPPDDTTFDSITVGAVIYGEIDFPSTGSYNDYYPNAVGTQIGTVTFAASGEQRVRMSWNGPINFDWISFDWPE